MPLVEVLLTKTSLSKILEPKDQTSKAVYSPLFCPATSDEMQAEPHNHLDAEVVYLGDNAETVMDEVFTNLLHFTTDSNAISTRPKPRWATAPFQTSPVLARGVHYFVVLIVSSDVNTVRMFEFIFVLCFECLLVSSGWIFVRVTVYASKR